MSLSVIEARSKKEVKSFIDFPHDLYKGDKNYVPQLHVAVADILNKKKNPFFKHSEASFYLAYKDNKLVGRIAAILNNEYNKYHESNIGFFGFFDCINDYEVASALFAQAQQWLKQHKVDEIHGPTNLTTNETAGLLIDGYDAPPVVEMTYNYPYYEQLIEKYGFAKEMDLFAYFIPTKTASEKSLKLASRLEERLNNRGVTIRNLEMKNFKTEIVKIKELYTKAWEKNWGFVPPTTEEFDHLAEGLKLIVNTDYAFIAETENEVVGFALALPNINEILINVPRGRLFPTGIFKLLWGKKKVKVVRVTLLGVIESYRGMGIEGIFFAKLIQQAKDNGLDGGEASWILENNEMMVKGAEKLNGHKYKTYRIYSKELS